MSNTIPLVPNETDSAHDATVFRKVVGQLQYLSMTRPDISFATNKLSQFMHNPSPSHWQVLKRLLCFIKGTIYFGLFLKRRRPLTLCVFSDSDWGGTSEIGRSTTGYVVFLGGNAISWKSTR
ncbi:uncharacterized mitochondrial protein AtMg00810-like [Rutidosis leptorrhynchoides]|uniref:uncharacterized mitochondrial protein AtMg00810-like n=1 Tax=Rutidosis leptorrhynchoides TaxID=125765 RepID=UPI003A9984A0